MDPMRDMRRTLVDAKARRNFAVLEPVAAKAMNEVPARLSARDRLLV
jgi:hypothetical protein